MAIYLMQIYLDSRQEEWLRKEWAKTGKKLDMGKSCIRLKEIADVPLDVIAKAVERVPVKSYIAQYESILKTGRTGTKKG
jgi:hypothetical protein